MMDPKSLGESSPGCRSRIGLRLGLDLFFIGVVSLFLELACIRWFSSHVLFLTFFTNSVLLACFLGLALGCLLADRPRDYILWTPLLLVVAFLAAHVFFHLLHDSGVVVNTGANKPSGTEEIFFGTEYSNMDLSKFIIPVEVVAGFFFLLLAVSFLGIGQEMGRALNASAAGITAYTLNTLGGLVGVAAFSVCSWARSSPFWWFLLGCAGLAYLLLRRVRSAGRPLRLAVALTLLAGILLLASVGGDRAVAGTRYVTRPGLQFLSLFDPEILGFGEEWVQCLWSPYYRIDYASHARQSIWVNLIFHQQMDARGGQACAYALPHLLNRDAGGAAFQDVLIIGAGSGNDVSRALHWGASRVDAVEIDPVIQGLGQRDHPDHPYQDERVSVHLDDGRNFLRTSDRQYDLIVYALVDSLVLHSGYSNIRLESYLFTREAFADVRRHLKPGGLFVVYNYFRQGWVVTRLSEELTSVFQADPLVLNVPHRDKIEAEDQGSGFTTLFAGDTDRLRRAFRQHQAYWLRKDQPPSRDTPNGFLQQPEAEKKAVWIQYTPSTVVAPHPGLPPATDDWPFLYLHHPMIPELSVSGMLIMGSLSLVLILFFTLRRDGSASDFCFQGHMFCLGAGFMLIETRAVVVMALLFGSTWVVNSIVLTGVLAMILVSNAVALWMRPDRLWTSYVGVLSALGLGVLVPTDVFLGVAALPRLAGSFLLVFGPILFAGMIFALSLRQTTALHQAFGANIAGAVFGGLAEYTSMLLGFRQLLIVAVCFYLCSAVFFALFPQRRVILAGLFAKWPVRAVGKVLRR